MKKITAVIFCLILYMGVALANIELLKMTTPSDNNSPSMVLINCPVDTNAIRSHLVAIAEKKLGDSSIELAPSARQMLLDFIDKGVNKLIADGAANKRIGESEANLSRFIDLLIKTQRMQGQTMGSLKITKSTVKSSFSICPLYPFCQ